MKKIFACTAFVIFLFSSCKKEAPLSSEDQRQELVPSSATVPGVVHITESEKFEFSDVVWNPCTEEWIVISGTGHFNLRWIISDNKSTFVLHINWSGVKGVGQTSGTQYVTTSTFNYNNTDNLGEQVLFQQSASTHFVALGGGKGSFTVINDWHLTVNANGVETFFFTTGGDVISCK